jgi:branched-chain amino acid transport system permease protein
MDGTILLILLQDGVVNGAIYALLALSLVLVFTVTRVVFIPQGELVAFAALTYAALDAGALPASLWLLLALALLAAARGLWDQRRMAGGRARLLLETLAPAAVAVPLTLWLAPLQLGVAVSAGLSLLIVAPMAPALHRIAFAPLAGASVLTLLIAAVGVHFAMLGLGLVFFGPEGVRATGFSDARFQLGPLTIPGQSIWILGVTIALMAALAVFFGTTLSGKALRATAVNALGARLVGIPAAGAGRLAFALAGFIGALSGVLIAPLMTVYYDTGFLIGLKGFVAAIFGGLASYPAAALGAIFVGLLESFGSFWASAYKEVIVFTIILPVLLWRSFQHPHDDEEE